MARSNSYVFVLWGEGFDEVPASVFVTVLRDAGIPVKVTGLARQTYPGAHGLSLSPDWTLEQALPHASRARGIVLPCDAKGLHRVKDDPRLLSFCEQAHAGRALFIAGQVDLSLLLVPPAATREEGEVITYPDSDRLLSFAREMVPLLAGSRRGASPLARAHTMVPAWPGNVQEATDESPHRLPKWTPATL